MIDYKDYTLPVLLSRIVALEARLAEAEAILTDAAKCPFNVTEFALSINARAAAFLAGGDTDKI